MNVPISATCIMPKRDVLDCAVVQVAMVTLVKHTAVIDTGAAVTLVQASSRAVHPAGLVRRRWRGHEYDQKRAMQVLGGALRLVGEKSSSSLLQAGNSIAA